MSKPKHPVVKVPGWGDYEIKLDRDGRFRAYHLDTPTAFDGATILAATMRLAEARRGFEAQQNKSRPTTVVVTTLGGKRT